MTTDLPAMVARLRAAGCVFAEDEADLLAAAGRDGADVADLVRRRCAGEPLEHLLGWAAFGGLRVVVAPGVFVPRRRTELLVRLAAAHARAAAGGSSGGSAAAPVVVDLCCGSGAVALALTRELADLPGTEFFAADIDPVAVRVARENLGDAATVVAGDLFAPLPDRLAGRIDVLVANVPYVPTGAIGGMPPEARDHEPRVALDGGDDGLAVLRRVATGARSRLAPGGRMFSEISEGQIPAATTALASAGLEPDVLFDEDLDATAVTGTLAFRG